jgi:hypothetical protein
MHSNMPQIWRESTMHGFEAEITGVTMFDVERLTNVSPVPIRAEEAAVQRVRLTKEDESSDCIQRLHGVGKDHEAFRTVSLVDRCEVKTREFQGSEDKDLRLLFDASEYCRAHGFQVEHEWNPGSPKDFLLPMASYWQADMIVLGNSARNLLMKRVLGGTSLYIIRNADRPLFLCQ